MKPKADIEQFVWLAIRLFFNVQSLAGMHHEKNFELPTVKVRGPMFSSFSAKLSLN